jgi:predicted ArsR family transcriptional regulator
MSAHLLGVRRELTYRALADPSRRHLLRLLDDAGEALDVDELSNLIGLHTNTVRAHLELLRHAGMVTRSAEHRSRPGRPKMLYRSTPGATRSPASEGYQFLAEVLAGCMQVNLPDPSAVAEEAGRAWGRYMMATPKPFARHETGAIEKMMTALAQLGFSPDKTEVGDRTLLRLHDCPFREVARNRSEVVCSIHLGILRGMAEELGDSVTVEGLQPFVEPSLCNAILSTHGGSPTSVD